MKTRILFVIFILFTWCASLSAQEAYTERDLQITDLGHSLYMIRGLSNSVLAVGDDGAILVDALLEREGDSLVTEVGELKGNTPLKYLINTHYHGDHTGGNAAIIKAYKPTVAATEDSLALMSVPYKTASGADRDPLPVSARPTDIFNGKKTYSVNGITAQVIEIPVNAHTKGDAFVYFPEANVLVMGDLHHSHEYPVYDTVAGCACGSYEGNLVAYQMMLDVADYNTIIVPGHGDITDKAEVAAYVEMLKAVRAQVAEMIDDGKTEEEVIAAKLLANDRSPQPGGPDNRDNFVSVLYKALKTGIGD